MEPYMKLYTWSYMELYIKPYGKTDTKSILDILYIELLTYIEHICNICSTYFHSTQNIKNLLTSCVVKEANIKMFCVMKLKNVNCHPSTYFPALQTAFTTERKAILLYLCWSFGKNGNFTTICGT